MRPIFAYKPKTRVVADRILSNFDHDSIIVNEKKISKITLSIGITDHKLNEGVEQLLHRADLAMYEAKQCKGNSVVIAPCPEESLPNMPQSYLS